MCFKGSCDVTNEAERLRTERPSKEKGGGGACDGRSCGGGRLVGDIAMETYCGAGEAVAVGGDDSTLAARK